MKKVFFIAITVAILLSASFSSCRNQDISYSNYTYQTLYFPYQSPVRKIVLGDDDQYDNSSDTAHECEIMATIGGEYSNGSDVTINFKVDTSLCTNVYTIVNTKVATKVVAMPSNYYTLGGTSITIPKGSMEGGVVVHLTDAFFNDTTSLKSTYTDVKYVIPLVMTSSSKDSILRGTAAVTNPIRTNSADWSTQPMDYILYGIKYINPWDANWLCRGIDNVTQPDGTTKTITRHPTYVESDAVVTLTSNSIRSDIYPVSDTLYVYNTVDQKYENTIFTTNLLLTFDSAGQNCTITSNTSGYTASGTGTWIKKGEKNSWGSKDRDGLYLNYNINFNNGYKYATKDTLVLRDRNEKLETFTVGYE
jgi:hypothetical protein